MRRVIELVAFELGLEIGVDVKGHWYRNAIEAWECGESS